MRTDLFELGTLSRTCSAIAVVLAVLLLAVPLFSPGSHTLSIQMLLQLLQPALLFLQPGLMFAFKLPRLHKIVLAIVFTLALALPLGLLLLAVLEIVQPKRGDVGLWLPYMGFCFFAGVMNASVIVAAAIEYVFYDRD